MPIQGISNTPRLPRLGKIRLGIRSTGGRGDYPQQTPYFVCPPEVREVYGDRPTALEVAFPTDDDTQWADPWYKCYSSAMGLVCKGDGMRARRRVDMEKAVDANGALPLSDHPRYWPMASRESKSVALREIDCPPDCPQKAAKQCSQSLSLQ
ncbi:MAG: hypothetical protein L0177_14830, partial [Chloroflexi bacterium]|nr:hypothetical protein [Chloroflexota bacterium]